MKAWSLPIKLGLVVLAIVSLACTDEVVKEVPVERIVTQEVVKEVPVEKIVEVEKTVVETVEVEKPVEVIKEVVREVQVPGQTVVVEKEVEVLVVATPTPGPEPGLAPVAVSEAPRASKQAAGEVVYATTEVGQFYGGLNSQGPMRIGHPFVCEDLFRPSKTEPFEGLIATNWTLDDDLLGATVSIQQGAQFHGGYARAHRRRRGV